MQFVQHDLGSRSQGEIVEVHLKGNAANVRLLDSSALSSYKAGRRFQYIGGHATRSPVRLTIPRSGHWYVVVDLGGLPGRVSSSAQVLPGRAPAIRQAPAMRTPVIVQDDEGDEVLTVQPPSGRFEWDIFISHATEDKDAVVRQLAGALVGLGLKVWYDEFALKLGDSLRRNLDQGLAKSRFGVVVISHAFFAKNWTQYELDGLVTRESTGDQVILPIWHNISKDEVIGYSPSLADKIAVRTADSTIEEIAAEIADRVAPDVG